MLTLLAAVSDEGGFTLPDNFVGIVIWVILGAAILGAYAMLNRTRRRAREDYLRGRRLEAEMRANDPDMKKEE